MYECPECGEKKDEEDIEYDCPFCGESDMGEGFYRCENCETLFNYNEDLWECEYCHNEGITEEEEENYCPFCGKLLRNRNYCYTCGWPNNQGWIGEQ